MDAFQKCLDSKDEVIQKCEAVNDTLHQQLLETENNLKTLTSEHEKTKIVFRKSLTLKDWIFVKQQTNPKKPKSKFLAKLNLCNFVHLPWEHTFLEYPNKRHHYFVIISLLSSLSPQR